MNEANDSTAPEDESQAALAIDRDYRYVRRSIDVWTCIWLGGLLGSPWGWLTSLAVAALLGVLSLLIVSYRLAKEDAP